MAAAVAARGGGGGGGGGPLQGVISAGWVGWGVGLVSTDLGCRGANLRAAFLLRSL